MLRVENYLGSVIHFNRLGGSRDAESPPGINVNFVWSQPQGVEIWGKCIWKKCWGWKNIVGLSYMLSTFDLDAAPFNLVPPPPFFVSTIFLSNLTK